MNGLSELQSTNTERRRSKLRSSTSLPAAAFPDKKRENTNNRYTTNSPNARTNTNPLFIRRMSSGGYSSCEESPRAFRRMTSTGSISESTKPVKYLFGTPKALDGTPVKTAFLSRHVLAEITKDIENDENRPPSPRPSDPVQVYVEHNRQVQVWDNWIALNNSGIEDDVAYISYRRTESLHAPEALPKALKPLSLGNWGWEE